MSLSGDLHRISPISANNYEKYGWELLHHWIYGAAARNFRRDLLAIVHNTYDQLAVYIGLGNDCALVRRVASLRSK